MKKKANSVEITPKGRKLTHVERIELVEAMTDSSVVYAVCELARQVERLASLYEFSLGLEVAEGDEDGVVAEE